ncbi:hypothetical protein [Levilactobacillus acidifarinae]|uniref:Uncharacterized protein n=1 Tax=Levilactobacillus acidifarinae DSM 19394 = JCM 15949 TaxID=1423715 RepID=A0A0R1LIC1_9LACO|nr:hypothetical protein [Levilactobacillus acidifarinae]KRK95622.1 hypothetical protein FD25_GL000037 [Levilactobacillus acidifarinae DSM 19394]GEO69357.1 hypothetical protein LAC03_12670 [Levilactobacillus acidifarinae]
MPSIDFLERTASGQRNYFYIVGYPAYRFTPQHQLALAPENSKMGNVTRIDRDAGQRYVVQFQKGQQILLTEKRVAQHHEFATTTALTQYLQDRGVVLPAVAEGTPLSIFQSLQVTQQLPREYVVVDCEFAQLFQTQRQSDQIHRTQTTVAGINFGVFQLSALGYAGDRAIDLSFNRYVDRPEFAPEMKLRGLTETGVTMATYTQRAAPLAVLRAFITQVLARRLPLVFWNYHNDLKALDVLIQMNLQKLTEAERAIVLAPLTVFDGETYMSRVLNRHNLSRNTVAYQLPLNGVAGLLNIVNPHQHNALWDAQTTQTVLVELTKLQGQAAQVVTVPTVEPAPTTSATRTQHWLSWWPRRLQRGTRRTISENE